MFTILNMLTSHIYQDGRFILTILTFNVKINMIHICSTYMKYIFMCFHVSSPHSFTLYNRLKPILYPRLQSKSDRKCKAGSVYGFIQTPKERIIKLQEVNHQCNLIYNCNEHYIIRLMQEINPSVRILTILKWRKYRLNVQNLLVSIKVTTV